MQVCTLLQTDNHANTSPLSFFAGQMPFLPPNQQRQSTEGISVNDSKNEKKFIASVYYVIGAIAVCASSIVCLANKHRHSRRRQDDIDGQCR